MADRIIRQTIHFPLDKTSTGNDVAGLSTDSNGNPVLIGADGEIISIGGFGTNVFTVGNGGTFATIQAAIDHIESLPQFEVVTGIGFPTTITAWAQGSSTPTVTGATSPAPPHLGRLWMTHPALNGKLYPIQACNAANALEMEQRRYEASFSGSQAITVYKELWYTIKLLDAIHDEAFEIGAPVNLSIVGTVQPTRLDNSGAGTVLPSSMLGAGFTHGNISFIGIEFVNVSGLVGAAGSSVIVTCDRCISNGSQDGPFSPGGTTLRLGKLRLVNHKHRCLPSVPLGHFILADLLGDLVIEGLVADIFTQTGMNPDFRMIDQTTCRRMLIDNVVLNLHDATGNLAKAAIVAEAGAAEIYLTKSVINYMYAGVSTTELAFVMDDMDGANAASGKIFLGNIGMNKGLMHTGTTRAYKSNVAGSSAWVNLVDCGQLKADKTATGLTTYQSQGFGEPATNGAQTATLTNLPAAATAGNPNMWKKINLDDGTVGYVPVWK